MSLCSEPSSASCLAQTCRRGLPPPVPSPRPHHSSYSSPNPLCPRAFALTAPLHWLAHCLPPSLCPNASPSEKPPSPPYTQSTSPLLWVPNIFFALLALAHVYCWETPRGQDHLRFCSRHGGCDSGEGTTHSQPPEMLKWTQMRPSRPGHLVISVCVSPTASLVLAHPNATASASAF